MCQAKVHNNFSCTLSFANSISNTLLSCDFLTVLYQLQHYFKSFYFLDQTISGF